MIIVARQIVARNRQRLVTCRSLSSSHDDILLLYRRARASSMEDVAFEFLSRSVLARNCVRIFSYDVTPKNESASR